MRDVVRNIRPQGQVSAQKWEDISDKFVYAKKFMSESNPIYMKMRAQLKKFEDDILENKLQETHKFNFDINLGVVKDMLITPKKLQDDETVGQIKYLRNFFRELEFWIFEKEDYEKQEADGLITIDRGDKG